MFMDLGFDLVPVAFVIADFLAGRTNGHQAAQCFYFCQ
jgi:hypothetical protein